MGFDSIGKQGEGTDFSQFRVTPPEPDRKGLVKGMLSEPFNPIGEGAKTFASTGWDVASGVGAKINNMAFQNIAPKVTRKEIDVNSRLAKVERAQARALNEAIGAWQTLIIKPPEMELNEEEQAFVDNMNAYTTGLSDMDKQLFQLEPRKPREEVEQQAVDTIMGYGEKKKRLDWSGEVAQEMKRRLGEDPLLHMRDTIQERLAEPTEALIKSIEEEYKDNPYMLGGMDAASQALPIGATLGSGAVVSYGTTVGISAAKTREDYLNTINDLSELGILDRDGGTQSKAFKDATTIAWMNGGLELASNLISRGIIKGSTGAESAAIKKLVGDKGTEAILQAGKLAKTRLLGRTILGWVPEYMEESITESIQTMNEVNFWADLSGGERTSIPKELKKYMTPETDEAKRMFASTLVFQAILGQGASNDFKSQSARELTEVTLRDQLVSQGVDPKVAEVRARNIPEEFYDNVAYAAWQKLLGLTKPSDVTNMISKGYNIVDLITMQKDNPQLLSQVISEYKINEGGSPSYQQWKELREQAKKRRDFDRVEVKIAEEFSEGTPAWFERDMKDAGYEATRTRDLLNLSTEEQIGQAWNLVSSFAHVRGKTGQEFYEEIKSQATNPGVTFFSSPEQARETVALNLAGTNTGPEFRANLDREMAGAKNLKDALVIFKSEMEEITPDVVKFIDKIMESPNFNKQAVKKEFNLKPLRDPDGHYDGQVLVDKDGRAYEMNVDPDVFANDIYNFAETILHETLHVVVSATLGGTLNNLPSAQNLREVTTGVFNYFIDQIPEGDKKEMGKEFDGALSDQEEFLTYFLSSPKFRERLLGIVPGKQATEFLGAMSEFGREAQVELNTWSTEGNFLLGAVFDVLNETRDTFFQSPEGIRYEIMEMEKREKESGLSQSEKEMLVTMREQLSQMENPPETLTPQQLEFFQKIDGEVKAETSFDRMGKFLLNFREGADFSSLIHEWGHIFLESLSRREKRLIAKSAGLEGIPARNDPNYTLMHEHFARNFETYMGEGIAPSLELQETFDKSSAGLLEIFKGERAEVPERTRKVFDRMLAKREARLRLRLASEQDEFEYQKLLNEYKIKYQLPDKIKEYEDSQIPFQQFAEEVVGHYEEVLSKEFFDPRKEEIFESDYKKAAGVIGRILSDHLSFRQKVEFRNAEKAVKRLKKNKRTLNGDERVVVDWILENVEPRRQKRTDRAKLEDAMKRWQKGEISLDAIRDVGGTPLNKLGPDTLAEISKEINLVLDVAKQRVVDKKLKDYDDLSALLNATREELGRLKKSKIGPGIFLSKRAKEKRTMISLYGWAYKPETIIESFIGSKPDNPLYEIFIGSVNRGVDKQLSYQEQAEKIFSQLEELDLDKRSDFSRGTSPVERWISNWANVRAERISFDLEAIQNRPELSNLAMTKAEILSLYMLAIDPDARRNILEGGIILGDYQTSRTATRLTEKDLDNILKTLSPQDLFVAKVLNDYFEFEYGEVSKTFYELNSLTLERSGPVYFPKTVDRGSQGEQRAFKEILYSDSFKNYFYKDLESSGKLKERTTHRRPLVIGDAFSVAVASMQDASKYVGLAGPMRAMRSVLFDAEHDRNVPVTNPDGRIGTQEEYYPGMMNVLKEKFGPETYANLLDYYDNLIGAKSAPLDMEAYVEGVRRRVVLGILGLNFPVALKQTASVTAYLPEVDGKILLKAAVNPWSEAEMSAASPQMRERFRAGGHRDIYETYREYQLRNVFGESKVSYGDFSHGLFAIKRMDAYAIGVGWRIAELEGYKGDALKERAEYLIRHTQPNYHVKDRTKVQRANGQFFKTFTTFGSVRATYANMHLKALHDLRDAETNQEKASIIAKNLGFIAANTAIIGSINLGSSYLFGYAPEDEEEIIKQYIDDLAGSTIGTFYGIGEIYQRLSNPQFGQENIAIGAIADIAENAAKVVDDPQIEEGVDLLTSYLTFLGVPAKNVMRLIGVPLTIGESK